MQLRFYKYLYFTVIHSFKVYNHIKLKFKTYLPNLWEFSKYLLLTKSTWCKRLFTCSFVTSFVPYNTPSLPYSGNPQWEGQKPLDLV